MSTFNAALLEARNTMERGAFRDAFKRIADEAVSRPDELFLKVALMADAGIALRDGSMLEYGLYLLEHHSRDVLDVPSLAAFLWLNIANLRSNLLAVREAEGGRRCWYERRETAPARKAYRNALAAVGDDDDLKVRILTAHAMLLDGIGRDWEAFELFHSATQINPDDEEAAYGRARSLAALAGTAPALETELLKESSEGLGGLQEADGPGSDDSIDALLVANRRRLGSAADEPAEYPRHSVVTNNEREHTMVMYSLKNRLYLSPCAACHRCDRAVGDAAALGAHHALVGGKRSGRYRKMALLTGRLTERYRILRAALIDYHRDADLPDGADHQPHFPEVDGWRPLPPSASTLVALLAGLPAFLEGMAACVAAYLGREVNGPVKPDHLFGTPVAPGSALVGVSNPALHGFWDLWADGMEGQVKGAELLTRFGSSLTGDGSLEAVLDDNSEDFESQVADLCRWLRDLLAYLIRMADRDARGESGDPPLWTLQPFILPEKPNLPA